jgi:hypothetical protein
MRVTGGCLCGAVRFEVVGEPSHETFCHCTICRRSSGASPVAWVTFPADGLRYTSGAPNTFRPSDHGHRFFCGACGSPLAFRSDRFPEEIDIATCVLDDPAALPPRDHTQGACGVSWAAPRDGLPVFPFARGETSAKPGSPERMLFLVVENIRDVDAVGARFAERGRMLPDGVSYLASWSAQDGRRWYQLMEAPGAAAIEEWTKRWQDLVAFEVHAVVPSAEFWARRGAGR